MYFEIGYAERLTHEEASVPKPLVWYFPYFSVTMPGKPDKS
jgi:hypothetical protein